MILNHEVVIEAPIERVWGLLDEVENVIACIPGAEYLGRDGDDHKARIKVKVGAITANFEGTFRFVEKNEAERTVRIYGAGKDIGGKASASATMSVKLDAVSDARTKAMVEIDLAITGRLAQFGGSVIADIAARMIEQFSQNLHEAVIAKSGPTAGSPVDGSDQEQPGARAAPAEALDVGGVLAKRGVGYAAILIGILVVVWLLWRIV